MIRVVDDKGGILIGLVRGELVDKLVAGERVCLPGFRDANGIVHPHICLVIRGDNNELLDAMNELYPKGPMPGAEMVVVTGKEPTG